MQRSRELELMDADGLAEEELVTVYRQIRTLQNLLGNTGEVIRLLRKQRGTLRRVLDIGCGQGALLLDIRRRMGVDVVGMDLRAGPAGLPVEIVAGNVVTDPLPKADAAVCMMLAHHLSEGEVAEMIRNVSRSCNRFILLDLVRNPVPLALFRIFLAPFLSPINAADGQTSIRRAFTPEELRLIVDGALAGGRQVRSVRHTVAPLWTRQVMDIQWDNVRDGQHRMTDKLQETPDK